MEKKSFVISKVFLNGFKSFPFKTNISISEDITCIVGPNGCGKSNLADAIQWVLGEQKPTEVRLKEMPEVIFSGNKKRKGYSFAEVSLFLKKNGAEENIKITRKIHSSGECNYYINEKNVRLKDLKDFLNSENLNINSYAILSQGEIERVALLKPYEKRYLIEECAGIFRFKEKERMTLLKLEDTEKNLSLTKHLLDEQEKIAHSLKIQAGRAKAFKQIEEEEKNLLKFMFAQERDKLKNNLEEVKAEILKEEEKELFLIKNKKEKEIELEKLEEKQRQMEKDEQILREKSEKISLNLQELKFEIEKREEKIKDINERKNAIEKESISVKEEIEKNKNLVIEKENTFKEKEAEIKSLNEEIYNLEKILEEIDGEMKIREEELKKESEPLDEVQKEKNNYGTNIVLIKDGIEKSKTSLLLEEKEFKTFSERKNSVEIQLKEIEDKIKKSSGELLNLEVYIEKEAENFKKLEENLREKDREIQKLKAELVKSNELKERELALIESYKKDKNSLAFLLKPPLSWEKVVDVLFDEIASAIISEEENPKGEGLFIIPKEIPLLKIDGAVPVKEILKLEENAPKWLLCALPGIYFVEDESKLKEIASKNPYFTFFDKNGRIIKGSLFGIPPFSKKGVMGSKLKAELLKNKIIELESVISEKEISFENLKKDFLLKEKDLNENKSKKESLLLEISELKNLEGQIKIQQKNLIERIEEINHRIKNLKENIKSLEEKQKENSFEAKKYLEMEEEIKIKIKKIKREIEEIKIKEKESQLSYQNKLKLLKEKEVEKERVYAVYLKLKDDILRNEEKVKILENENVEIDKEKEKLKEEIENFQIDYFNLKKKEDEKKEELEIKIQEKDKVNIEIKSYQNSLKLLRAEKEEKFKNIQELKTREEIIKIKLNELEEKSRNLLSIELDNCPSNEEKELEEKISKIKEKKERFGQVNPLAEKQLEEVFSKINFIKNQKEDLENSCKALKEDLKELEREALKRFQETFQKVNENFQKYFNYLFGGGQAKIILQDEEKPLEAGIELLVEPPGKKIQHIMLLSGGERALVSFAFLLSLFSTSPSPFLFLDEADASLDDMNVERFINLINKLKKEIQIILVTHNRRTMEEASLLLGVTMEEPGLSKVLCMKPKELLNKL